jgi:hypothetical protein
MRDQNGQRFGSQTGIVRFDRRTLHLLKEGKTMSVSVTSMASWRKLSMSNSNDGRASVVSGVPSKDSNVDTTCHELAKMIKA